MKRQEHFFGIPVRRTGAATRRNALIILALVLGGFSPALASKPVTTQAAKTSAAKEVKAKPSGQSTDNKAGAGKPTSPKASPEKIARGKFLFNKLTCSGCHPNGENSLHPYRPLKGPGFLARYKEDGQIEQLIRTGVLKAGMPSFSKARVDDNDMTDLIAYIRSLTPASAKNELKK